MAFSLGRQETAASNVHSHKGMFKIMRGYLPKVIVQWIDSVGIHILLILITSFILPLPVKAVTRTISASWALSLADPAYHTCQVNSSINCAVTCTCMIVLSMVAHYIVWWMLWLVLQCDVEGGKLLDALIALSVVCMLQDSLGMAAIDVKGAQT